MATSIGAGAFPPTVHPFGITVYRVCPGSDPEMTLIWPRIPWARTRSFRYAAPKSRRNRGDRLELSESLLEISLLLVGAVFIGIVARRFRIPVTVVLAVGGFLVAWAAGDDALPLVESLYGEQFAETVVNLFLPILIFEATINLSTRDFLRNLGPILVLATVALAISATLVGFSLHWGLGISLASAMLFGVLISATDPVAVLAVFKNLGVPRRLLTLVEGESLMNDGVAIVGYSVLLQVALGDSVGYVEGMVDLVTVFVGGALIGAGIGLVSALVLPMLDRLSAATLSLGVAYGSFVLADAVFGVSGVMATAAAGLIIGALAPSRASASVRNTVMSLWDALAYIANALLFLFVGLLINPTLIGDNLDAIALAIVAVLIARPLAIFPVVSALERFVGIPKVGNRNSAVLVWGGLRGGVALALALALPPELPERELFIAMTGGVVLVTLLLNATTISTLVHRLGLDKPNRSDQFLEASARLLAIEDARDPTRPARIRGQDRAVRGSRSWRWRPAIGWSASSSAPTRSCRCTRCGGCTWSGRPTRC